MRDSLKKHRRQDRVKWIITEVAVLLISIVLVAVCLQVFGSGKAKPSEWFKNDEKNVESISIVNAAISYSITYKS